MDQQTEEQAFRQLFRSSVFLSPESFAQKSLQIIRIEPEAVAQEPGQLQFDGRKEGVGEVDQTQPAVRADEDVVRVQITVDISRRFRASFIQIRPSFPTKLFRDRLPSRFRRLSEERMAVEGLTWEIHPVNNLTQASSDPAALRPGHVCAARRQRFSFHVFQQQIPENIGILDHALGVQPRRRDTQLFCPPQAESFREEIVFSANF